MAKVLVFAEQREGKLKKASFELLAAAAAAGHEVHAVLAGSGVSGLAEGLGAYGASTVHVADEGALKNYTAEAYARVMIAAAKALSPAYILATHSPMGRDLMPHVAVALNAGLASDCTVLKFNGDQVTLRRPVYAGKATAEVEFTGPGPRLVTVRANALGAPKADASKKASSAKLAVDLGGLKTSASDLQKGSSERPDVTEASIVISGGRAMKNAENFKIIETLADTVGAAVGASRAAVDAGYRPHRDQVGQTGKVVSPSLYVACGISGAIQHLAGMRTSKCIVAINTDPQAPIFQVADYGVVADLFTLVPLLTQEFKKLKDH
ncbi:MAG TPA: electron transfer flavoprotein subunit alpha/FixB family protein [Bdellovibrionota bacterium]|jgi:electron transfer flavoprotein alpha subunit|nr:electron transfer flavoprotein subunit alpha/FixB family protein [Bdellovibrionota bacterium]